MHTLPFPPSAAATASCTRLPNMPLRSELPRHVLGPSQSLTGIFKMSRAVTASNPSRRNHAEECLQLSKAGLVRRRRTDGGELERPSWQSKGK
jgi:hypothetical protein